ncbi:MAG: AMP-binding protein [Planctomycetota bacterium]|nr:MAG: AMP-binding protein [Planctomycetota bacterium]
MSQLAGSQAPAPTPGERLKSVAIHNLSQGQMVVRLAELYPEREALIFPDRGLRWTFQEFERRTMELSRGLIALGVQPGEKVTVWADNRPDWISLQFALARIGAVLVTANTGLKRDEIGYVLNQSQSVAVVAMPGWLDQEYLEALEDLALHGEIPGVRHLLVMDGLPRKGMKTLEQVVELGETISEREVLDRTAKVSMDQAANIQYTSGTTGFPKGVVLTHANLVENAWTLGQALNIHPEDKVLLQVPLFHCFGCAVTLLSTFTHGATLVGLQRFDPLEALRAIDLYGCTLIHGVPTMFHAILTHPDFDQFDTTSLRAGVMAGAPCPEDLMHKVIEDMHCQGMVVGYGLTEAAPLLTMTCPSDSVEMRCTTVGRAIAGVQLRVVDPITMQELPAGEPGEIQGRGPNVMLGYFDRPEATAETILEGGWLRTGDMATLDVDGVVRIVGRIKEMIIRGGENIYPAEVEDVLRRHPEIHDVAVFGLPSEKYGEEVAAAIVLRNGSTLDAEHLAIWEQDRLAHFKRPKYVFFVDAFPLTPSGKIQKYRLTEIFRSEVGGRTQAKRDSHTA